RPNDVTDPDATNPDPAIPPTNPYDEIDNNGLGGEDYSNNIQRDSKGTLLGRLTAAKSISGDPLAVVRGNIITYKITIDNPNNIDITGASASDELPAGLIDIDNISPSGNFDINTRT